jgi:spore germination cell wall hydrolase CwlJ-like protein
MIKLKNILIETYVPGISDTDIVAATIIGEAGGESFKGMQAIKNVLQNRANKRGTSLAGEALRPKQFSVWNKATAGVSVAADFNKKGRPAKIQSIIDMYKKHSKWTIAEALATKKIKDITGGSTMYYASGGSQKISPPYWAKDWTDSDSITIGNHTFGN